MSSLHQIRNTAMGVKVGETPFSLHHKILPGANIKKREGGRGEATQ